MSRHLAKIAAAALMLAPLLAATGAQAHAHLVSSAPAAASAGPAPKALHLQFSEGLEAKFSKAELSKADAPVAAVSVAKGKGIDLTPKTALTTGLYKVVWSALSTDGHKSSGDYSFAVK